MNITHPSNLKKHVMNCSVLVLLEKKIVHSSQDSSRHSLEDDLLGEYQIGKFPSSVIELVRGSTMLIGYENIYSDLTSVGMEGRILIKGLSNPSLLVDLKGSRYFISLL